MRVARSVSAAVSCLGIRLLDGPLTDSLEAVAFNKHYQVNDIYSCRFLACLSKPDCACLLACGPAFMLPSLLNSVTLTLQYHTAILSSLAWTLI